MEKKPALTHRLAALWNRPLSRRVVPCLCAAWLLFMMLPLFALCFYDYPSSDDFINILPATEVWAQTGSLMDVLRCAIEGTIDDYLGWQGTFVAMFQGRFQPMIFSLNWFWVTPFLTLALFFAAVWFFVRQVCRLLNVQDRLIRCLLYTVWLTLLLAFMPGIREAVYWQSATQYILSFLFLLPMAGMLISIHLSDRRRSRVLWSIPAALCAFCAGACPYPVALGAAVGLFALTLWSFGSRSRSRWACLISCVALCAALLLVIIAPGNSVRQNRLGDSMNPVVAIAYSVDAFLENSSLWLGPQCLILLAVLPLLWKPIKASPFAFAHPFWAVVFALGAAAAAFVPSIYAMGPNGYQYDRIMASLYLWFALCLFVLLLYLEGWLTRRMGHVQLSLSIPCRAWHGALCLCLVLWGLFGHAIFASPVIGSYTALLTGEVQTFHQEITQREQALLEAGNAAEARQCVQPLSVSPMMFANDLLVYQVSSQNRLVEHMHRYYKLMELLEEYGPGSIPEAEWQALNAWDDAQ